jgi:hypothetical protein
MIVGAIAALATQTGSVPRAIALGREVRPSSLVSDGRLVSARRTALRKVGRIVVLAGGRGGIGKVIRVAMPRPRDRGGKEFGQVRGELLREFHLGSN